MSLKTDPPWTNITNSCSTTTTTSITTTYPNSFPLPLKLLPI